MARFLADEDFDAALVQALRALGHDVLRHQEDVTAPRGESDEDVLARAAAAGRVLLTHNRRDFVRIHRSGAGHAGILTLPQRLDAERSAEQIDALLAAELTLVGRLFRVNRPPAGPPEDPK
jgi:hypothetical protein